MRWPGSWRSATACRRSSWRRATAARRPTRRCATCRSPTRRGWRTSPRPRRSRSPWSAPRRRWPPAWWTCSAPAACASSAPRGPRRSSRAPRPTPRISCSATASPPRCYASFTDAAAAHAHVDRHGAPIVVKADGLAAGKGVVVAMDAAEAHAAIDDMLRGRAGARVVIEEFMAGEEASFIVMCDGQPRASAWPPARTTSASARATPGPNTGGMGAYSPAPVVTPNVHARVMQEIILPTVPGMAQATACPTPASCTPG